MRVICWNMAGGFGYDSAKHARAWDWLNGQSADVALLQEVVLPDIADDSWRTVTHSKMYAHSRTAWGTAVLTRSGSHRPFEPSADFAWLREFRGSVSIAQPSSNDDLWLISVHSNAYRVAAARLEKHVLTGMRQCSPGELWEIEALAYDLERLLDGQRFILGGDLNSSLLFDEVNHYSKNQALFKNLMEAGFVDLRTRHFATEQQTYFKAGRRAYQLDHVFADAETEGQVQSWSVISPTKDDALSDHAPLIVDLN